MEKARNLRAGGHRLAPVTITPLRRVLKSSLFYLPLAGLLAALTGWLIIEPHFADTTVIGGEVILANRDPFDFDMPGAFTLTIGDKEAIVVPGGCRLEAGADGQPPFAGFSEIGPGTVLEASGEADVTSSNRMVVLALRPATLERTAETGTEIEAFSLAPIVFFPLTALLIALALLAAEGISSRNWVRMVERLLLGGLLALVFSTLAMIPAGLPMTLGGAVIENSSDGPITVATIPPAPLVVFAACRSIAWAAIATAMGLGMHLARSTKAQLRNAVVGGALGGAIGGLFFDPIDRFFVVDSFFREASASRLVGMLAVGLSVGLFMALVDLLAREAWIRVRTGPLAGKAFVLYRTPTTIGSTPQSDIYLMKDAGIDATHAVIHRVGNNFEIEDMGSRTGTKIKDQEIRRRRLSSGDQIVLGDTVLEFEERAKAGESLA